jgi:hypothetical protein
MEVDMTHTEPSQSPADRLTALILESLISESLLEDALAEQIATKVATGRMQSSDWKLTFEKSLGLHKRS